MFGRNFIAGIFFRRNKSLNRELIIPVRADGPDHPAVAAVLVKITGDQYSINNAGYPAHDGEDDTQYK